ncbi:MAG: thioredoxin family protein [Bacteroidales bacterium]|jgi:thioredoxin-like negative regulator of GroEL|nr:thioredoxin family protein [Bacteroidales bacterium]
MNNLITNQEQFDKLRSRDNFTFIYFKNDRCSVCDSLLPQLVKKTELWQVELFIVDCYEYPDIAAQNMVLTVPALKVYFDNQEIISMLRFVDLAKLETDFSRLKEILG